MGVLNRVGQLHFLTMVQCCHSIHKYARVQRVRHSIAFGGRAVPRKARRIRLCQERVQIKIIKVAVATTHLTQKVRSTNDVFQGSER